MVEAILSVLSARRRGPQRVAARPTRASRRLKVALIGSALRHRHEGRYVIGSVEGELPVSTVGLLSMAFNCVILGDFLYQKKLSAPEG